MATVGTLNVGIRADTRKFDKAMRDSRKRMREFDKTAKTVRRTMLAFGGALAGAAGISMGIRGMTSAMKDAATRMDSLAKTSAKLGIASEQLAGLQHAANQTGVSTELLNSSIEKMVVRTSEAAQGTGTAADALKELGLSATELNSLRPNEQFVKIAQAMKGVENQADKTRLAYDIFGRSGVGLLNTLNLGAAGLARFSQEAKNLGLAISNDDLKKIERANDAMDTFRKAFEGTVNQMVIDMAPAAAEVLEGFTLAWIEFNKSKAGGSGEPKTSKVAFAKQMSGFGNIERAYVGMFDRLRERVVRGSLADINKSTDTQLRTLLGDTEFERRRVEARRQVNTQPGGGFARSGFEMAPPHRAAFDVQSGFGRSSFSRGPILDPLNDVIQKTKGAFDFIGDGAKKFETTINKWEGSIELFGKAAEMQREFVDPSQALSQRLKDIEAALSARLIGAGVAGRARDAALEQFGGTPTQQQQNRLASLAEVGTIEGFKAMRQRPNDDPQKKTLEIAGKQLTQLEKLNELIERQGTGVVVLGEGVG